MLGECDFIDIFHLIAERKIAEAIERGAFDDLPGRGKPLPFSHNPLESPDQRLASKILKNAGIAPIEISLRRELDQLKREYARAKNANERRPLMREIRLMVLRINLLRQAPVYAEATEALVDEYGPEIRNPKSETNSNDQPRKNPKHFRRNPKQIPMLKTQNPKPLATGPAGSSQDVLNI